MLPEYSRRSSLQEAMAQEVLALLDLKVRNESLMSAAATGRSQHKFASRASKGSVVGVDPSRDMISFARSHFGPAMLPNLRFEVADARRLPFKNEFDLVVSFNALHWIPEQQTALSSIRSTLVSGARRSFAWYRKVHARAWKM
jgi:ubiquinone/menaquinone biosynthesis C-methylase UbiE